MAVSKTYEQLYRNYLRPTRNQKRRERAQSSSTTKMQKSIDNISAGIESISDFMASTEKVFNKHTSRLLSQLRDIPQPLKESPTPAKNNSTGSTTQNAQQSLPIAKYLNKSKLTPQQVKKIGRFYTTFMYCIANSSKSSDKIKINPASPDKDVQKINLLSKQTPTNERVQKPQVKTIRHPMSPFKKTEVKKETSDSLQFSTYIHDDDYMSSLSGLTSIVQKDFDLYQNSDARTKEAAEEKEALAGKRRKIMANSFRKFWGLPEKEDDGLMLKNKKDNNEVAINGFGIFLSSMWSMISFKNKKFILSMGKSIKKAKGITKGFIDSTTKRATAIARLARMKIMASTRSLVANMGKMVGHVRSALTRIGGSLWAKILSPMASTIRKRYLIEAVNFNMKYDRQLSWIYNKISFLSKYSNVAKNRIASGFSSLRAILFNKKPYQFIKDRLSDIGKWSVGKYASLILKTKNIYKSMIVNFSYMKHVMKSSFIKKMLEFKTWYRKNMLSAVLSYSLRYPKLSSIALSALGKYSVTKAWIQSAIRGIPQLFGRKTTVTVLETLVKGSYRKIVARTLEKDLSRISIAAIGKGALFSKAGRASAWKITSNLYKKTSTSMVRIGVGKAESTTFLKKISKSKFLGKMLKIPYLGTFLTIAFELPDLMKILTNKRSSKQEKINGVYTFMQSVITGILAGVLIDYLFTAIIAPVFTFLVANPISLAIIVGAILIILAGYLLYKAYDKYQKGNKKVETSAYVKNMEQVPGKIKKELADLDAQKAAQQQTIPQKPLPQPNKDGVKPSVDQLDNINRRSESADINLDQKKLNELIRNKTAQHNNTMKFLKNLYDSVPEPREMIQVARA